MLFNVSRGMRSRTQVSHLTSAEAEPCPCKVFEASLRQGAKTYRGIPASLEEHRIDHLGAVAQSAIRKWLRSAPDWFKNAAEPTGIGSSDHKLGKLERDARGRADGGLPRRLQFHAGHSVLRKVSTALRVRINPSMDELGPYIVINDVTSADVLIIAQILED